MTAFDALAPHGPQPPDTARLPHADEPTFSSGDQVDGWWSLLYRGWTLLAPSGARIDLTEIERACFLCLLRNPNRELLRQELMATRASTNLRTLNVAICRLRSKVLRAGIRLPLHTVHGVGYVFLGNLRELSTL
ncbi:winged helix-turn-helix transcriptional regulator [Achromobacter sp. LC458]|uniref:winged helix-turn-helix domain-containing protein n=1 Tax=Achromobacter sp. LC458 TaxID=1120623 RepID=UPI00062A354C|nr:winged helix-turn-helix domain-containing protein [Achromobacter sp. LC458]TRM51322.1 winged helix-turn-helix transcriptional regulator [Achromobacter sp. LC458]